MNNYYQFTTFSPESLEVGEFVFYKEDMSQIFQIVEFENDIVICKANDESGEPCFFEFYAEQLAVCGPVKPFSERIKESWFAEN